MMKKEQKFSRSPSKLIILYILITFFVLIIGIRYYFKQKEEIRNEAYTNLSVIAEMKANQISNWRNERLGDANVIFNSKFLVSDLKKMFDNSSDVILKSTIISHFSAYYNFYHYKDIIIFDTNAFIKYSLDSKLSKLSKISFAQLKNAGKDKKPVFSEIYICDLCNDLHLDIVIPLFEKDVLFGGIILRIDPEEFLFPLIQTWPTTSPTSETLLIIKEGDGVVYLNELRHQKNTALKLKFKIDSSNYYVPSVMAVMGKTGLVEGLDYRGVKVLSDIRKITDSQWYMIAKVDLDEIYAPVKEKAINISILTGLVLISFAIGFIWVWTNQKKSIRIQHLEEERKHQALIKHFDYIVKYANDILLLTDRDFNIVEANDSAVQAFGYSSEELVKLNVRDLRAPETLPQLKEQLKNLSITGRAFYETIYKRKDGTTFPVEASIRTVEIEGAVFYQAIVKDITERKQAERALKESEIKFRSLFENAILGIYRTTPEGQIIECNPALSRMLGFDNLEDLAKRNLELIGFEPGYSRSEFKKKIEKEGEIIGLETAWIKKDGTSIYVSENTKAIRDDDGKFLFYEGTVEDITERKRAEELLMREKELYIDLVKSMPSGVYRVKIFSPETWKKNAWNSSENAPYSMELVSDRFCEILGVSKETYAKNPGILNDLVHPEDKAVFAKVHEDAMSSLTKFSWDGRIVNSGKILWVHFESLPRALENGDVIWTGSVQDITERKQAEEALHLKNSVFDTSIAANSIADVNGVITEVNDAFLRLWDYLVKDEVIGKPITHFLNDPDEAIKIVDALNNTGEWEGNYIAKKKDGSTFIAYGLASIVKDEAGKTKGYQSSVLDMTERMKAEESIKNLSLRNEAILSSVPDIIMEVDNNKVYTWANSSGKEFFGDDVIGKEAKFYFEGEQETYKNVEPLFTGDENIFYLESWQRRQDGEKRILAWWCRVLKDTEGNVTGALSSAQDITEIKKAEQELFESENLFRNMNINSPLGMHFYELNDDNKLIFVGANPAADKILEVDNSQFIGKTIEEAFPPLIQTEVPQRYREAAEKGTLWSTEQIDYKDKKLTGAYEVKAFQTSPGKMVAVFMDITNRKKAEEELRESERKLREAQEMAHLGYWYWDVKTGVVEWSEEVYKIFRLNPKEFTPQIDSILALSPWPEENQRDKELINRAIESHEPGFYEQKFLRPDRSIGYYSSTFQGNYNEKGELITIVGAVMDITERKLAEESLAIQKRIGDIFLTIPDDEMYNEVLNVILEKIESPFGVFGFIDENGANVVPTMTRQIWDKCEVPEKSIVFPRDTWGDSSWPTAIREKRIICSNDYSANTPEGHIKIRRHISLPIIFQNEVIGLFQVANKETDYTETDINLLKKIAGYVAPVLNARLLRQRIVEEIRKLNEELELKVIDRTKELENKNTELSRMNRLFVGRELRMVELKQEIKELEDKLKSK